MVCWLDDCLFLIAVGTIAGLERGTGFRDRSNYSSYEGHMLTY